MKRLLILLAAVLALALARSAERGVWRDYVLLAWEYDAQPYMTNGVLTDEFLSFNLYVHTNVAEPLTNWMFLTNIQGVYRSAKVGIAPGSYFFALTASNWWGESVFSPVARVPGPPLSDARIFLDYRIEPAP